MTQFWQFLVLTLEIFILVAFLMILFRILVDLFSDSTLGGGAKAFWIIVLVAFPLIGALIYLIARGRSMSERQAAKVEEYQRRNADYIASMARSGSATELAAAKKLLDEGTITAAEYERIKAQVLRA